jgi:hypothetical protein
VVLVTFDFRHLASAPKVRWRARAGAPALEQEPKLFQLSASLFKSGLLGSFVCYRPGLCHCRFRIAKKAL